MKSKEHFFSKRRSYNKKKKLTRKNKRKYKGGSSTHNTLEQSDDKEKLVVCPEDCEPGDTIAIEVDGEQVELEIPEGVAPGDAFEVNFAEEEDSILRSPSSILSVDFSEDSEGEGGEPLSDDKEKLRICEEELVKYKQAERDAGDELVETSLLARGHHVVQLVRQVKQERAKSQRLEEENKFIRRRRRVERAGLVAERRKSQRLGSTNAAYAEENKDLREQAAQQAEHVAKVLSYLDQVMPMSPAREKAAREKAAREKAAREKAARRQLIEGARREMSTLAASKSSTPHQIEAALAKYTSYPTELNDVRRVLIERLESTRTTKGQPKRGQYEGFIRSPAPTPNPRHGQRREFVRSPAPTPSPRHGQEREFVLSPAPFTSTGPRHGQERGDSRSPAPTPSPRHGQGR
jgi:hypothetical protein